MTPEQAAYDKWRELQIERLPHDSYIPPSWEYLDNDIMDEWKQIAEAAKKWDG